VHAGFKDGNCRAWFFARLVLLGRSALAEGSRCALFGFETRQRKACGMLELGLAQGVSGDLP
jgi:hypothetical protein